MLDPKFQERLDKWRKNALDAPSSQKARSTQERSFRASRDYGDDLRDIEKKDAEAWSNELLNNPIYRGYI
jgi:hypothetical protein